MNHQDHNTPHDAEPFGPVIYSYTRAQAVADGVQVEVTKTANEAGIKFADPWSSPAIPRTPSTPHPAEATP